MRHWLWLVCLLPYTLWAVGIPVAVTGAKDGFATVVIEDAAGHRVRDLAAELPVQKGANAITWDGLDNDGHPVAPGAYHTRGLTREALKLAYQCSVYTAGSRLPWFNTPVQTATDTGWLSDHNPAFSVCAVGDKVFVGAITSENGQDMMALDLDGHKLWGLSHPYGCGASDFATDGKLLYAGGEGQWAGRNAVFWTIDPATYAMTPIWKIADYVGIRGMAVHDGQLYVSSQVKQAILVFDLAKKAVAREIPLPKPEGIAFTPDGRLLAISGATLTAIAADGTRTVLSTTHLTGPNRMRVGADGTIYISDGPKSWYHDSSDEGNAQYGTEDRRFQGDNQVKVFDANGAFLRAIGAAGGRVSGPWNPAAMRCPVGLDLDAKGRLWVAEWDMLPKRISVWNPADGTLAREFIGAHKYGGAGALNPVDRTQMLYDGMLFKIDWATGAWRITDTIVDIMNVKCEAAHVLGGYANWPTRIVHTHGHDYYVSNGTVWMRAGNGFKAVACIGPSHVIKPGDYLWTCVQQQHNGKAPDNDNAVGCCGQPGKWCPHLSYTQIWQDANGDGVIQPDEVTLVDAPHYWLADTVFGPDLSAYLRTPAWRGVTSVWRVPVARFTPEGVPVWDMAQMTQVCDKAPDPASQTGMTVDAHGRVYTMSNPIYGFDPTTKRQWTYPNRWPAFGQGAPRQKPGLVIAGYDMMGVADAGGAAGELVAVNSDFGQWYLFTADGLFVATLFGDCRTAPFWGTHFATAKRGMDVNGVSLGQESFNGWFGVSEGKVYAVAGHPHCSVMEVQGLATITRFTGAVTVTPAQAKEALAALETKRVAARAAGDPPQAKMWPFRRVTTGIPPWALEFRTTVSDDAGVPLGGVFVVYDKDKLAIRGHLPHFVNTGADWHALLTTGDAVVIDLGLDANADPARTAPAAGDVRLILAPYKGKPTAMLLKNGVAQLLPDVPVTVTTQPMPGDTTVTAVEADVPWTRLIDTPPAVKHGDMLRGDVGIVTLTDGVWRWDCWAGSQFGIPGDLSSLSKIRPYLWGVFTADEKH